MEASDWVFNVNQSQHTTAVSDQYSLVLYCSANGGAAIGTYIKGGRRGEGLVAIKYSDNQHSLDSILRIKRRYLKTNFAQWQLFTILSI